MRLSRAQLEFRAELEALTGEPILRCNQCGKCSAGCLAADYMDLLPHQLMRKLQLGDRSVLESRSIRYCMSCMGCSLRCPMGIDLANLMDGLRALLLRKGIDLFRPYQIPPDLMNAPQLTMVAGFRKLSC